MPETKLPKKLKKEPLIDAIFEARFTSDVPTSEVLPGILYSKLDGSNKKLDKLPAHEIPSRIRQTDPNLQFATLVRIDLDNYHVSIGDRNVVISCKMPYQGWGMFKPNITSVLKIINETGFIKNINRYSMKYVDLIEGGDLKQRINMLDASISIGQYILEDQIFSLRVEIPHNDFINIVNISSSGKVISNHSAVKEGIIVDTDTIFDVKNDVSFEQFFIDLSGKLDGIHTENKRMFFNSLKDKTIEALEPEYGD